MVYGFVRVRLRQMDSFTFDHSLVAFVALRPAMLPAVSAGVGARWCGDTAARSEAYKVPGRILSRPCDLMSRSTSVLFFLFFRRETWWGLTGWLAGWLTGRLTRRAALQRSAVASHLQQVPNRILSYQLYLNVCNTYMAGDRSISATAR